MSCGSIVYMDQNYSTFNSLEHMSCWSFLSGIFSLVMLVWFCISIIGLIYYLVYLFINRKNQDKKPIIVKKIKKFSWSLVISYIILLIEGFIGKFVGINIIEKPVIYLYPEKTTSVSVKINHQPGFLVTYPSYNNGWNVIAHPDGKLINQQDGKEYSYLYWEGKQSDSSYDLSAGFVVNGNDTALFLQEKLSSIGLTPKEYNEFIVYWLPQMVNNPYNLIHFATNEEYNQKIPLEINPTPDSLLRVFMVYKPLNKPITIKTQSFTPFIRNGFTVVEWGGSKLK